MNVLLIFLLIAVLAVPVLILNDKFKKRKMEDFLRKIGSGKIAPPLFDTTIHFDHTGFRIKNDKTGEQPGMTWAEVVKATAYKRDHITVDQICIFMERKDQTGLEIHEEMNRWMDFITSLPDHLPSCKAVSSWLESVTLPPFAKNVTELYSRKTI